MGQPSRGQSPANRQARQEKAQAAAMNELEVLAETKRRHTKKLRELRLQKDETDASNFKRWREQKS